MATEDGAIEPVDLLKVRHDLGQTIELGLPTPEECLAIYQMLGPTRSLPKIGMYLRNQARKAPADPTLKNWSKKHNWKFHIDSYDRDVTARAIERTKQEQAEGEKVEITTLATKYRTVTSKLLRKIEQKIEHLKLADGTQLKAAVDAAVNLAKAAEVMDGGVSDRTESRNIMTLEERKTKAMAIVDDVFANLRGNGGNDNRTVVADGAKPGTSAAEVPGDSVVGRRTA